jgi:ATP-dependent Clp protease adaptor protein ClpS
VTDVSTGIGNKETFMIIPLFPIVPGQLQVKTDEVVRPIVLLLPPWCVILHNDNVHLANDVADAIVQSVPGLSAQQAWEITLEAHYTGRSVVISCPRELAELYQERLQTFGLMISIEPQG